MSPLERYVDEITQTIERHRGRKIIYLPVPGNAGDSLIATATFQMFTKMELSVTQIMGHIPEDAEVALIAGGGNFVPIYNDVRNMIECLKKLPIDVILLPHTIRGNDDILRNLDEKFTLFCRDAKSYEHVTNLNIKSQVILSHDMAFSIDFRKILGDSGLKKSAEDIWRKKLLMHGFQEADLAIKKLWAFNRIDIESKNQNCVSDLDLSDILAFGTWAGNAELSAWSMLKTLSLCQSVATDRLHVAIGCAVLGIPCELRDNSYGKNHSIFCHSFRQRFPNVLFSSEPISGPESAVCTAPGCLDKG